VISNFLWNRHWTYPDSRSRLFFSSWGCSSSVNLAGIGIRIPILHYVEPPLVIALQNLKRVCGQSSLLAKNANSAFGYWV
jgi:putative flippase GtrA